MPIDDGKKIYAFFGGSFDPLHNGHIALVDFVLQKNFFTKVFLLPVPQAPHKQQTFFTYNERLFFLQETFKKKKYLHRVEVSDLEKHLPPPQYTFRTMQELEKKFNQHNVTWAILMGSDSFATLGQWKNAPELVAKYAIYVAERKQSALKLNLPSLSFAFPVVFLKNDFWNISSTQIKNHLTAHNFFDDKKAQKEFLHEWKNKLPSAVFKNISARL